MANVFSCLTKRQVLTKFLSLLPLGKVGQNSWPKRYFFPQKRKRDTNFLHFLQGELSLLSTHSFAVLRKWQMAVADFTLIETSDGKEWVTLVRQIIPVLFSCKKDRYFLFTFRFFAFLVCTTGISPARWCYSHNHRTVLTPCISVHCLVWNLCTPSSWVAPQRCPAVSHPRSDSLNTTARVTSLELLSFFLVFAAVVFLLFLECQPIHSLQEALYIVEGVSEDSE